MFAFYQAYLKPCVFTYRGIKIITVKPHVRPIFEEICASSLLITWLNEFPLDVFKLDMINICDVEMTTNLTNPYIIKFTCTAYEKATGDPIRENVVVILKGRAEGSRGILVIAVDEEGERYVVLTETISLSTGGYREGIYTGKTEINTDYVRKMDWDRSIDLGSYYVSTDLMNEKIHLEAIVIEMSKAEIDMIRTTGRHVPIIGYGGYGTKIYDYDEFDANLSQIADTKTALAWMLYRCSMEPR